MGQLQHLRPSEGRAWCQEKCLNEELRTSNYDTDNFNLPSNWIWIPPMADRTTTPTKSMELWFRRPDYQACIEHDRLRLNEALETSNMLRIRGTRRKHRNDEWTEIVLLNIIVAPFTLFFLTVENNEQTTRLPIDKTEMRNIFVLATYGLGGALEGDTLPPLSFPTSSTKGRPREKESPRHQPPAGQNDQQKSS